ncbi:MAG: hypothetical protein Q8P67_11895 [archaeon]|nr:hypothetical protein [archaeon]
MQGYSISMMAFGDKRVDVEEESSFKGSSQKEEKSKIIGFQQQKQISNSSKPRQKDKKEFL